MASKQNRRDGIGYRDRAQSSAWDYLDFNLGDLSRTCTKSLINANNCTENIEKIIDAGNDLSTEAKTLRERLTNEIKDLQFIKTQLLTDIDTLSKRVN